MAHEIIIQAFYHFNGPHISIANMYRGQGFQWDCRQRRSPEGIADLSGVCQCRSQEVLTWCRRRWDQSWRMSLEGRYEEQEGMSLGRWRCCGKTWVGMGFIVKQATIWEQVLQSKRGYNPTFHLDNGTLLQCDRFLSFPSLLSCVIPQFFLWYWVLQPVQLFQHHLGKFGITDIC